LSELSIIIPCYNEEKNLINLVKEIKIIKKINPELDLEFILVNDGSTDQTSSILQDLNQNEIYKFIDLKQNMGYGGSIQQGLKSSSSHTLSWTHSDLQCDLNDVIKLYKLYKKEFLDEKIIVKGKRIERNIFDSFFSNSMAILASIIFQKKFYEINAQPKIFSRKLFNEFENAPRDFSLDLYLLYISKKKLYKIIEHPVVYKKRIAGVSKGGDSFLGKIKLTLRTLKYIINLRLNTNEDYNSQSKQN
jgi:glycosyltransferase involved in cell wall biosynthesis